MTQDVVVQLDGESPSSPSESSTAASWTSRQGCWCEQAPLYVSRAAGEHIVRSCIDGPVIQALCRDRLFLDMLGHYWLAEELPPKLAYALSCPWPGCEGGRLGGEGKGQHGRWVQEALSLCEHCRPSGGFACGLWPPISWNLVLQVAQDREKSVCSICFHPLETTELLIPLNIL